MGRLFLHLIDFLTWFLTCPIPKPSQKLTEGWMIDGAEFAF